MSNSIRCLILITMLAAPTRANEVGETAKQFISNHCLDCHTGDDAEAGFDAATLDATLKSDDSFEKWVRAFDRIESGEMPPKDSSEVTDADRQKFVKATGTWLRSHQQREHDADGRVRARRLTNLQLERTLHDLLGIDIPLASQLPDEPRTDGFTTVADGQPMSHFQLERHLSVVDAALDEAFRRAATSDDYQPQPRSAREMARRKPRRRTREPEMREGKAVVWSGGVIYYGRLPITTAKEDGWYRFTLTASALKKPDDRGVWCTVRRGRCVSSAPQLWPITELELQEETNTWTFDAWLPEGHMLEIRPSDKTLKQARFRGGQIGTGEGEGQNVPGLAMDSITIQRIHKGPSSEQIREMLFSDIDISTERKYGRDKIRMRSKDQRPGRDIDRLVRQFARRAFRCPVQNEALDPFVSIAKDSLRNGGSLIEALRLGYRAVLCSPRFLYFHESAGELDDYAFASRLSYFLWNTMPDNRLMNLAASGQLREPKVLRQQVDRMLTHPRGQKFVHDFAHEWLELSEIDFTEPDRRRFRDFDSIVQESMLDETHAFLQAMLDEDLSVTNLIDSDFTYLNSRLARYYGIEGVTGDKLQRVKLKPTDRRGGVLTHGSILKITANGTTTSPVVRGVWVAERLLGQHIPPPPENVPAIEPDIRGAKTIREMLAKHRSDASCASCHVKIDPPGFALENFDPSGKWRDRYYHRNRKRRLKIDPSYQLADGRSFNDVREFQKLVTSQPDKLAHNVAEKLLTYGTGAGITFADRPKVDDIVAGVADNQYGFRSLLHAVVASEVFQSK